MLPIPIILALAAPAPITVQTLVNEMTNLDRLTHRPVPFYKTVEQSSYDRGSVAPDKEGWFANGDAGKYLRSESRDGREEWVMADLKGPGAVVRLWSANPMGTVRFYFDGETTPRLQARLGDLLQGRTAPFLGTFAYNSANGCNLYFPFPFAKSFKATVAADDDKDRLNSLYYQFNVRQYDPTADVRTYEAGIAKNMRPPQATWVVPSSQHVHDLTLKPGTSAQVDLEASGPVEISDFTIECPTPAPKSLPPSRSSSDSILKHVVVAIAFDGQETVRVPLPDLFGAGILPGQLNTMVSQVEGSSKMRLALPMPFQKTARIRLFNESGYRVQLLVTLGTKASFNADYILHGQWSADIKPSRPMRDMNFVDFEGDGRYVGTVLHVQNPTPAWWGEGDEKVYVDGESFPSWIGTGTEDYFGYAWSNPQVFSALYHGQARADGPGCGGQIGNVRWHVMDDIPFKNRINFNIEMWHWEDVPSRFDKTAFWYAPPGTWTAPKIKISDLDLIAGPKRPEPVKGAIEGEKLEIVGKTGGATSIQDFPNLSSGQQLWWVDPADGDTLELSFEAPSTGIYKISANCCTAVDYGIHQIFVNGHSVGTQDFYNKDLAWKVFDWGKVQLSQGKNSLKIVCAGTNSKSSPARRMFGLDYLLLKK